MLLPLLPFLALLIKLDSKGPVFYPADRVGLNLKRFRMWKFRTMVDNPAQVGESLCAQFDPRVTRVGRFLRRTKLNELPQLFNILRGEMTFVGPRPETPDLAELYPESARKLFSVKPGLVSPATILGRNEEELYPPGVDVKQYYIKNILPGKAKIDLEYIENPSLAKDMKYILSGVMVTLVGAISKRHIQDNWSQICLLTTDTFLVACSYLFANLIHSGGMPAQAGWAPLLFTLTFITLTRLGFQIYFGMYSSLVRYISSHDALRVFKGVGAGSVFLVVIAYFPGWIHYPGVVAMIDWVTLLVLLSGLRFTLRIAWDMTHRKNDRRGTHRVLIYGVCDEGNALCRAYTDRAIPLDVVGFIDDVSGNFGKTINGKKVLGNRHHLTALARLYRVDEVLIADPDAHAKRVFEVKALCEKAHLRCRTWDPFGELVSAGAPHQHRTPAVLSDMIHLKRFQEDAAAVQTALSGKTVLMHGSGGALGSTLCRRALHHGCGKLIILERYESYLNELVADLMEDFDREKVVPVLIQQEDPSSVEDVFRDYLPNYVIQAGMRKFEPFTGVDLGDVESINYLRTFNLAKAAARFHSDWFLMISSLASTINGGSLARSLRVAEASLEHFFHRTNTGLMVTRVCDVIENRGGICSTMENQIRDQGVLTLPGADSEAFLISKNDAAAFILQSLAEASSQPAAGKSRLFSCDPGAPTPLILLGERIANLYGKKLGSDIPIRYTRPMAPRVSSRRPTNFRVSRKSAAIIHRKENLARLFRDFAPRKDDDSEIHSWKEWTQKFFETCGTASQY